MVEGFPFTTLLTRSFAEVLSSPTMPKASVLHHASLQNPTHAIALSLEDAVVGSYKGFPSMAFEDNRIVDLTKSFPWTLIGKFYQGYNKVDPKSGRPLVEELEKYFQSAFSIGLLDNKHLLIRLSSEKDYLRLYSRTVWFVKK